MAGAVQHEEARKATEQASKAAEAAAKAKEAPAPAPAPTPSPAPAAAAAQDDGEGDSASSAQEGEGEDSAAEAPAPAPEAAPAKLKSLEDIVESAKSRAKEFNAEMSSSALASKWLSAALKDDLNTSIAMEVEGMDEAALRSRVLNLSAQLLQRNKVEAARILEFMSEYNAHWQGRFEEFSAAQTSAFQADVQAAKQAFQQQVAEENSRILQAEAARLEADIRMQVTTQLSQAVQKEAAARAAAAAARVEALDELRAKVEGVSTVVGTRQEYETTARRVHSITLSALALSAALDKGAPLTDEVAAMRVAVAEEPGVAAALDAIPPHVFGRRGAPTRFALDNKFKAALAEARVAALTPAAGGVLSRWIGRATAALLLSPVPTPATPAADVLAAGKDAASAPRGGVAAVSSTVQGAIESVASTSTGQAVGAHVASARQSALSAVSSTAQSVRSGVSEAVAGALPEGFVSEAGEFLSRARQALPPPGESTATSLALLQQAEEAWAAGDLHRTVALVEQLRGLPAAEMKGWLAAATTRAIVEQAVAVSHAYASSVAGSLY
ncbi:mic60 [Symbiodinium sp. KB8]|nr:mic60 [Symbiodinium sp. KB8]